MSTSLPRSWPPHAPYLKTAAHFGISWGLVRRALDAATATLPDLPAPRRLGIEEHRFRSVRYFRDSGTGSWTLSGPWMSTIVDLDTGRVLRVVDVRDSTGVGNWRTQRPPEWRLGVQA